MISGFRSVDLDDPDWNLIKLLISLPRPDEPWGVLAPLRGTVWGNQLSIVPGDDLSHAFHGWATPLMRVIGVNPKVRAKRIENDEGVCRLTGSCVGATPLCRPGPKVLACYEAPGLPQEAWPLASLVARAWGEDRYVVVVDGPEFSL